MDAPSLDLDHHVRVIPVPAGEGQLLEVVEQLRALRLDRSRPLWQIWFLIGLPHRQVGMYVKLHHTIADGLAGVATLGALLDLAPDSRLPPAHRGLRLGHHHPGNWGTTTCAASGMRSGAG